MWGFSPQSVIMTWFLGIQWPLAMFFLGFVSCVPCFFIIIYSWRKHVRVFWQKSPDMFYFVFVFTLHFDMNNSKPDLFIVVEFIYLVMPWYRIWWTSFIFKPLHRSMKDRKAGRLSLVVYVTVAPGQYGLVLHSFPDHRTISLRVAQTQQFVWEIFYLYQICVFKFNLFFL